jgi:hypothetical protein
MVNAGTGFAMSSEPNAQPGGRIYGRDLNCPHFSARRAGRRIAHRAQSSASFLDRCVTSIEMPTEVMVGANASRRQHRSRPRTRTGSLPGS